MYNNVHNVPIKMTNLIMNKIVSVRIIRITFSLESHMCDPSRSTASDTRYRNHSKVPNECIVQALAILYDDGEQHEFAQLGLEALEHVDERLDVFRGRFGASLACRGLLTLLTLQQLLHHCLAQIVD